MLSVTVGETVLVMPNKFTRAFSIPPAFLAMFPDTTHWQIRLQPDGIKVSPHHDLPPAGHEPHNHDANRAASHHQTHHAEDTLR